MLDLYAEVMFPDDGGAATGYYAPGWTEAPKGETYRNLRLGTTRWSDDSDPLRAYEEHRGILHYYLFGEEITADRCQRMAKTITRIERRMKAEQAKFGDPESFGGHVARFARALDAYRIYVPDPLTDNASLMRLSVNDAPSRINELERRWLLRHLQPSDMLNQMKALVAGTA
jgi:hypothetical protein